MNIQEQEERDFNRMSPYEFETAAVHFKDQGSWFRVEGRTLMVAPAYDDGSVDATGWGPVEEHGFDCMGIRGDHEHDPAAVEWIVQINETFNTAFRLEEFE